MRDNYYYYNKILNAVKEDENQDNLEALYNWYDSYMNRTANDIGYYVEELQMYITIEFNGSETIYKLVW